MAFRFRRRNGGAGTALGGDAASVAAALDEAVVAHGSQPGDFDLAVAVSGLLDSAPTEDVRALRSEGMDDDEFYERELRPNWDDLSEAERAAKVKSFARLANVLTDDTPAGLSALVRTKLIVLAWAYDRAHGGRLLGQVSREPERFGRLELSPTH